MRPPTLRKKGAAAETEAPRLTIAERKALRAREQAAESPSPTAPAETGPSGSGSVAGPDSADGTAAGAGRADLSKAGSSATGPSRES